ncbi:MAG TPA: hypothetical protein VFL51_12630 [Pseudolabrys sp.]|nr:hypothetical protein [Pseudolabrys sp.]
MKPAADFAGSCVLNLTSRFVLERLPYLLVALAAAVLLLKAFDRLTAPPAAPPPSPPIETAIDPFGEQAQTIPDRIRREHAAFAPDLRPREIARAAEAGPVVR